ncbi:MAG: hypothetical protein M9955_19475 [Rhizobiaceae bacterium]|nr:hypothetical protein [Rhizobiaceae bacterium]
MYAIRGSTKGAVRRLNVSRQADPVLAEVVTEQQGRQIRATASSGKTDRPNDNARDEAGQLSWPGLTQVILS